MFQNAISIICKDSLNCMISLLWSSGQITQIRISPLWIWWIPVAKHCLMNTQSRVPIHSSKWLPGEGHYLFHCENQSVLLHLVWGNPAWWMEPSKITAHCITQSWLTKILTPTPSIQPPLFLFSHPFFFPSVCSPPAFQTLFPSTPSSKASLLILTSSSYPLLLPPHYLFTLMLVWFCVSFSSQQPHWYLKGAANW